MSNRISILPESITNKIAAGEVVERPASVIKELIENSLDAGADELRIDIAGGGRRLISVSDNGDGMSRDDALLSLERHATSKIRCESDLDGIMTLGFRGEALPSIASVSRFRLATRQGQSLEGTEIIVEGGKIRDVKACGMAAGTVITVEQLFFNTPARLKFLKSIETETGHIGDTVTRMAIAKPDVAFTLTVEGREIIKLQRGDLLRRLGQLLGKESLQHLHQLDATSNQVSITGFISSPQLMRSNNNTLYTYINGRFVRDKVVQHAVMQAYRGVIDRGRYPVVAIFIKLPGGDVDINVHPTKHEVRFRQSSSVHDAIFSAIENALASSPWLPSHNSPSPPLEFGSLQTEKSTAKSYLERISAAAQISLDMAKPKAPIKYGISSSNAAEEVSLHEPAVNFNARSAYDGIHYFSSFDVIGQFHGEYILCQLNNELLIIDQHAASERVAFEQLRQQHRNSKVEAQRLLFPETIELSHGEVSVAMQFKQQLASIGFDVEPFGGSTLLVSTVPRVAEKASVQMLVRDIISELQQIGVSGAFKQAEDALFARIACHSVVRGVHPLEQRQMRELLANMDRTDFASSCPHGRPVSHAITLQELEKIFKRS